MKNDVEHFPVNYFTKMKNVEEELVKFLGKQGTVDRNFNEYLQDQNFLERKDEYKSFLYLLVAISNQHYCFVNFFSKIEIILQNLQEKITNFFTNFEIFHIFQKSKRLLLLLFKLKILFPTEEIYYFIKSNKKFVDRKYIEYFYPEFEQYMEEKDKNSIRDQIQELKDCNSYDEFNKKRENYNYIINLIQNDLIVDFITYLERSNISPSSSIHPSIYETNLFLINKSLKLIEYSAFYGSIQIFKYLYQKNVEIKQNIWLYAIHGKNAEIIYFLEENKIQTLCNSYQYLIIESIKCHNNEIADYFSGNEKIFTSYLYRKALKYYNYSFFTNENIDSLITMCKDNPKSNIPYYLCKYDYFLIVENLLKNIININYVYTIYQPFDKNRKDIVSCIAIQNGVVDQKSAEDEEAEKEDPYYYYRHILKERKYTTYEYIVETSSLLHISIRKGNIDIMKHLLAMQNIDLNIVSTKRYKEIKESIDRYNFYYIITEEKTIFHEAILSGYAEIVQYLHKNLSFNINDTLLIKKKYHDYFTTSRDSYQENYKKALLHVAIEKGYVEIVKLLLSNQDIDINLKSVLQIDEIGGCCESKETSRTIEKSALYFAIENGSFILTKLLLENPKIDINFAIYDENDDDELVTLQDKNTLFLAVEKQSFEIVQLLIKHPGINLNYESTYYIYNNYENEIYKKTALQLASAKHYSNIEQLLSKK